MIQLFFITWLTCATYSTDLNSGVDLQSEPVETSTVVEDDYVTYGPEPMCGGSKEAGDRWCY